MDVATGSYQQIFVMSCQCTLAVVGDGAVGKSSIIAAFKNDGFARVYKQVDRITANIRM